MTRGDTRPRLQLDASVKVEGADRHHGVEAGPHRAFSLVLVSLRPAEVGQNSVA